MSLRYLLIPACVGSLVAGAYGQDFAAPKPRLTSADADNDQTRVVVTGTDIPAYVATDATSGTKTDTPLLDTPQTVNVIPRQVLDDQAVLTLNEALNNVGGVNTGGTYRDYDIYSIRGFFGTGFTFLDGLSVDRQTNFQEETFGLERVEVIQGPASVLYGQTPPGGLVNLISKTPQKDNFTNVIAGGGSFNLAEVGVDTNGVLNQSGSVYGRVNVLYRQWGTFTDHTDPSERVLFAPSLTIQLAKRTRLTLLGQYYLNDIRIGFPLPAAGTVLPNRNGDTSIFKNVGEPDFPSKNNTWRVQWGYQFEHQFNDVFTLRQNFRAAYHDVYFQGVYPGELQADQRTLTRNVYNSDDDYTTVGVDTSLVANFNTGTWAKHTALVGVDLFYLHDDINAGFASIGPIDIFKPVYGARPGNFSLYLSQVTDFTQTGVYFQEQVKFFDRLSLVGGGRGDFISNDVTQRLGKDTESDASPSAFSPRAGIVYEVVPKQVSAYFSYSKSFQSNPGYQALGGGQVEPEEGEQYEIGVKADLFKNRLSTTVALYQAYRTNVPTADPLNPGFFQVTGEERHRGVDFNTTASPLKGWDIIAAYGYVDARVTADTTGLVGNRPLDVPEHTFNLFTKYTLQNGPLRGLGLGVGFHYQTNQEGDSANTFRLPSFGTLNLAAYYHRGRFDAQFNVNNVTDERYASGSYNQVYVQQGDPINLRGSVGWHF